METITNFSSEIIPVTNNKQITEYRATEEIWLTSEQGKTIVQNVLATYPGALSQAATVEGISSIAAQASNMLPGQAKVFTLATDTTINIIVERKTPQLDKDEFNIVVVSGAGFLAGDLATSVITGAVTASRIPGSPVTTGIIFALSTAISYIVTKTLGDELANHDEYVANYKENYKEYHEDASGKKGLIIKCQATQIEGIQSHLNRSGFLGFDSNIDLIVEDGNGNRYEVIREDEYNSIVTELQRRGFYDPLDPSYEHPLEELFAHNLGLQQQYSDGYTSVQDMLWDKLWIFDEVTNKRYFLLDQKIYMPYEGNYDDNEIHLNDERGWQVQGRLGNDTIFGGSQNDEIYGDFADEPINYHDGSTGGGPEIGELILHPNTGNGNVLNASVNDYLIGNGGSDEIHGEAGNDTIYGDYENMSGVDDRNDRLYGDAGDDLIYGGGGADIMEGGSNKDTLYGGSGDDYYEGGTGNAANHFGSKLIDLYNDDTVTQSNLAQKLTNEGNGLIHPHSDCYESLGYRIASLVEAA